jgi:hypothetical protein
MKNQYFGDVNDYRKYGLLRTLQSKGEGRLLVAWMLTPDDGSPDGGLRSYLQNPTEWRHHDPELFTGLVTLLSTAPIPNVSLMERSALIPRASYYSALVSDSIGDREMWREGLLSAALAADLVFLDPDIGIEIPSKPIGRRGSSMYAAWKEIQSLWEHGCSILIYQHFPREHRASFMDRMLSELHERTGARFCEAFSTPYAVFLLAIQERDRIRFRDAALLLSQRWKGQITALSKGETCRRQQAN